MSLVLQGMEASLVLKRLPESADRFERIAMVTDATGAVKPAAVVRRIQTAHYNTYAAYRCVSKPAVFQVNAYMANVAGANTKKYEIACLEAVFDYCFTDLVLTAGTSW